MKILITNDDGFDAGGIKALIRTLKPYGELTIVAPKSAQSGMAMAVTMGHKPIAVKHMYTLPGEDWWYLDGTPASCVKYGIDNVMFPTKPDVVVSGINHGSNAATASIYSGTVGAAMEGAVNGIPGIGVSLDSKREAWVKAINTVAGGLPWQHISDLKGWDSVGATTYGVMFIPFTIFVGPDGNLVAYDMSDEKLKSILKEYYGE